MNSQVSPFVLRFNKLVDECENFVCITRAGELQREAIDLLSKMQREVEAEKTIAITAGDENYANLLLGCECVSRALVAELRMWLLLKEEKPDEAWDELVTAQMASVDAVRAHDGFRHLDQHSMRLEAVEKLIFPPQVFISSGMIVRNQECSICGLEYEDCEHLLGKPYMGKFCYIRARGLELDHVAIVDEPADKCCRVRHFSVEGGNRNRMTWRVEPTSDNDALNSGGGE